MEIAGTLASYVKGVNSEFSQENIAKRPTTNRDTHPNELFADDLVWFNRVSFTGFGLYPLTPGAVGLTCGIGSGNLNSKTHIDVDSLVSSRNCDKRR